MKLETFFDNFELLADAPNSVQKLRELILQLAVRGKLVPQDAKDEPAEMLVERIRTEKERLIKEKKIKKGIVLPPINLKEIPFFIPKSWAWVRLNDIGDWGSGSTPDRKNRDFYGGKILWFKSGELNDGYIKESEEKITELALQKCSLRNNKPGDVLFAMYGATVGKLAILEVEATTNQAVCACTCHNGFYNRYLFNLLMAYKNRFINESAGAAQPNFSKDKIIQTLVPLPPLAEQHRIVAKVDQLMSLCDELEARQQKKRESRVRLNSAALDRLLAARAPGEFAEGWRRVCDNFDVLYDTPENVGKLRQLILELAVRGKLVQQQPNEEAASILLKNIKADREQLIKEKRIKMIEALPPIESEDIPFDLPEGWAIERLGNIVIDFQNGISKRKSDTGEPIPVLRLADIKNYQLIDDSLREIKLTEKEVEKYSVLEGDFLVIRVNGSPDIVGRIIPCKVNRKWAYCDHLIRMRVPTQHIQQVYLSIYAQTSIARAHIVKKTITTAGQKTINQTGLSLLPVLLPPLEEQRRIVAKVDQLMSLCDSLEAGLARSQADGERLMEAVVGRMLAE